MKPAMNPYQAPSGAAEVQGGDSDWSDDISTVLISFHQRPVSVCALCGAPSVTARSLLIQGGWYATSWSIQYQGDTGEVTPVMLPLCQKHRNFRRWWPSSAQWLCFWPLFALIFVVPLGVRWSYGTAFLAALILTINSALLVQHIRHSLRISRVGVTGRGQILTGLSPAFVEAIKKSRQDEHNEVKERLNDFLKQM